MENGDMPIHQCFWADGSSMKSHEADEIKGTNQMLGLTKREAFAMAAMQGSLASDITDGSDVETIAEWAVECADALLNALEAE